MKQLRNPFLRPTLSFELNYFLAQLLRVTRRLILNEALKVRIPPEGVAFQQCLDRFVMDAVIGGRTQDSRQFPVGGPWRTSLVKKQRHDDMFRGLWFAWILSRREQSGHAFFLKLAQPTADGAVRETERVRLFFRRSSPGQARGNRMVSLLGFTSNGHFIKTQGELNRHRVDLLKTMSGTQFHTERKCSSDFRRPFSTAMNNR